MKETDNEAGNPYHSFRGCGFGFDTLDVAQDAKVGPNITSLAPAKTIAIVGGKVLTITHGTIEDGTVVMSGGKIVAVGPAKTTKVPPAQMCLTPRE